jgi:hypothetical protein
MEPSWKKGNGTVQILLGTKALETILRKETNDED